MNPNFPRSPNQQVHSVHSIVQLVQNGRLRSSDPTNQQPSAPSEVKGFGTPESANFENDDRLSEGSHSSSKLTNESRWLLIKQLAQRKALRNQSFNETPVDQVDGSNHLLQDASQSDNYSMTETESHQRYGNPSPQQQQFQENIEKPQLNNWIGDRPKPSHSPMRRAHSADPRASFEGSYASSSPRRNFDDSSYLNQHLGSEDARAFRHAQSAAALHDEVYKECTFHPRFYTSDVSRSRIQDLETPFYERVNRWKMQKETEHKNKKKDLERVEKESCTFQPKLNRNSLRAASEMRGSGEADAAHESMEDVATRLHKSHEESLMLKAKYIDMEIKRVQDEELRQCTFRPNISSTASSKYGEVKPKYHLEYEYKQNKPPPVDPRDKENTFTPAIKGITSKMPSAQVYVKTNVVDRLSKPLVDPAGASNARRGQTPFDGSFGGNVMDMNSYIGNTGAGVSSSASVGSFGSSHQRRPASASQSRSQTPIAKIFRSSFTHSTDRPSSAPRERGGPSTPRLSAEERLERKKSFDDFMQRQVTSETKKKLHYEETKQQMTPQFKPQLDKKSLAIAKDNDQSDFLDRMEKFLIKKNDTSEKRQSTSAMADAGYTFNPILTKKVDGMRTRTSYEMSQGDQIRRSQKIKLMASRREKEEAENLTFKPKLSAKGQQKQSTLKISEDPSVHLQFAQRRLERRQAATEEATKKKVEEEVATCTFAPETKKCPSFIIKIADGMKMINKARGNNLSNVSVNQSRSDSFSIRNPSPAKPSWRFT